MLSLQPWRALEMLAFSRPPPRSLPSWRHTMRRAAKSALRRLRAVGKLPRWLAQSADLPPALSGYRFPRAIALERAASELEILHPLARVPGALPRNVASAAALDAARPPWWEFSMRDVALRQLRPTAIATVPDACVLAFRDARGQFHPTVLTREGRPLALPELTFRLPHGAIRRRRTPGRQIEEAFWVLERNYDNHGHWLTAHLPKLCLLKSRGETSPIVLPAQRTPVIEESLAMLGLDPGAHVVWGAGEGPLQVRRLRVVAMERVRPELMRLTRSMLAKPSPRAPWRRIYISRARAKARRYLSEQAVWPLLEAHGFELRFLEDLTFSEELELLGETAVLAGPVGSGLTNTLFCPPGTHVIEIRNADYPVPDAYAVSSAMGHHHWLVDAVGVGDEPHLRRDLVGGEKQLRDVLEGIEACR